MLPMCWSVNQVNDYKQFSKYRTLTKARMRTLLEWHWAFFCYYFHTRTHKVLPVPRSIRADNGDGCCPQNELSCIESRLSSTTKQSPFGVYLTETVNRWKAYIRKYQKYEKLSQQPDQPHRIESPKNRKKNATRNKYHANVGDVGKFVGVQDYMWMCVRLCDYVVFAAHAFTETLAEVTQRYCSTTKLISTEAAVEHKFRTKHKRMHSIILLASRWCFYSVAAVLSEQ